MFKVALDIEEERPFEICDLDGNECIITQKQCSNAANDCEYVQFNFKIVFAFLKKICCVQNHKSGVRLIFNMRVG